jgi:hypothetical protein
MKKLVYMFVPKEFVIGQVVLKLCIKRLAVGMVKRSRFDGAVSSSGGWVEKVGAWMRMGVDRLMFLLDEAQKGGRVKSVVGRFILGCCKDRCRDSGVGMW